MEGSEFCFHRTSRCTTKPANKSFAAAAGMAARFSFSHRRSRLHVSGMVLNRIQRRGMRLETPTTIDTTLMAFHHWRLVLIGKFKYNASKHEEFCRILFLDQDKPDDLTSHEWLIWTYSTIARYNSRYSQR
jgi:hypothetical protein